MYVCIIRAFPDFHHLPGALPFAPGDALPTVKGLPCSA